MDRVYAIAIDAFCHGDSVRSSYTIAKGPFSNEEDAVEQIGDVVNELADRYSSLGTCGEDNEIAVKTIDQILFLLILMSPSGAAHPRRLPTSRSSYQE